MLYINNELSYDTFHENSEKIYRVVCQLPGEKYGMSEDVLAITPAPLATTLIKQFPEIQNATRFYRNGRMLLTKDEKTSFFEAGIFADKGFFNVFSFSLLDGYNENLLQNPQNILLTKRTASKFFGEDNPIGKTLNCYLGDFIVAGIIKDVPQNSHIQFDWVIPFKSQFRLEDRERRMNMWNWDDFYTFVELENTGSKAEFEEKLNSLLKTKYVDWEVRTQFRYFLQPLETIHHTSNYRYELAETTDISLIRLFIAVAIFVLLIACVNSINLSTANTSKRAKEIGVRKVVGSLKRQLFWQFTGESLLVSLISFIIAIILLHSLLPVFNQLVERTIDLNIFLSGYGIISIIVVVLLTGLISGLYPAVILSSLKPVKILYKNEIKNRKNIKLRNVLVLFQFSIAIVLMIISIIIFQQIDYIKNKDLGFNREHVLVFGKSDPGITEKFDAFKNQLKKISGIKEITTSSQLPSNISYATGIEFKNDEGQEKSIHYQFIGADYNFTEIFDIDIIKGRTFSELYGTDSENALIVNETFVNKIGWKNPVGKTVSPVWGGNNPDAQFTIVGVVKDFHARSLHLDIKPVIIGCQPNSYWVHIKFQSENSNEVIANIESKYNQFKVKYPFDYFFLDDQFNSMYSSEEKLGDILMYSNWLAIFIACLGILGLANYSAESRTKEIGIRKVLGATIPQIVTLLSQSFIKWIVLANIIAWPVAYFIMQKWLQNFAYHIDLKLPPFLLSGFLVLLIALSTVGWQTLKAAIANPVDSLRYE
jgi:putative ABC transport system permease protein